MATKTKRGNSTQKPSPKVKDLAAVPAKDGTATDIMVVDEMAQHLPEGSQAPTAVVTEVAPTEKQEKAYNLHTQIMANGTLIGQALYDLCRLLKQMRDEELFRELGYETFERYTEEMVGIKYRQAFNYIKAYEKLDKKAITSGLGIKKLELLTTVPDLDRQSFIEENDLDGMTTAELQEKIKELYGIREQLTLEAAAAQADAEEERRKNAEKDSTLHAQYGADLKAKLEEAETARQAAEEELASLRAVSDNTDAPLDEAALRDQIIDEIGDQIRTDATAAARQEVEAEKKKAVEDAKREAKEAAEKAAEKRIKDAEAKARKEAMEEAALQNAQEIARAEAEREAQAKRADELEKKLGLASSAETTAFSLYFEQFGATFDKMMAQINSLREKGQEEDANKLLGALIKAVGKLSEQVNQSGSCT